MTITLTPANAKAETRKKYGGIEATPVSAPDRGLAIGIYGNGGVGKTTLAATITDSEMGSPALLLDARGNPHVIASKYAERIDVLPISKFAQVEQVRQDILKDRDLAYKSIILDNVSEMFHLDLRDRYGPVADVGWEKHSATTADILQLVRNWMDMATAGPRLNIVFVFQEVPEARTIRGQQITSRSELAFNKSLQFQVPTLVNFLGRLYQIADTPPYQRLYDLRPVETVHQAKAQFDPNDEYAKEMTLEQYNPSLASILDTIRGRQPWPAAKHVKGARA